MSQPRYLPVGGFFGAGKTTALMALAHELRRRDQRVAVIVNAHGAESIDAAEFRAEGFPTEEVGGGDLGTRFNSLMAATKKLEAAATPDVVLIEAVGTSLDLNATVARPLREIEGRIVGPLSVVVDPTRAEQVFGLAPGRPLPDELSSLYRRQVEEAHILVLAANNHHDSPRLEKVRQKLAATFPAAPIVTLDDSNNHGLAEWITLIDGQSGRLPPPPQVDPLPSAGDGTVVGCLQAVVELTLSRPAGSLALLESVGRHLRHALAGVEVLHLHAALRLDEAQIGTIHFLSDNPPRVARSFTEDLEFGELMINLRAATHPEQLHTAVRAAIVGMAGEFPGLVTEFAHLHYFRPLLPEPMHRLSATSA